MKAVILTQGKIAVVDDEDFDRVNQYRWHAHGTRQKNARTFYAARSVYDPKTQKSKGELMHHFILGSRNPVDHKNGDGSWNTRDNIRRATQTENCRNFSVQRRANKTSKYKGVYWNKIAHLWWACIKVNKKRTSLRYYHNEKDAARAYDEAAIRFFGEFARTNQMIFGDLNGA